MRRKPPSVDHKPLALTPAIVSWLEEMAKVDAENWNVGRWEFLKALGDRQDPRYIEILCTAIESEEAVPAVALIPLRNALLQLLGNGPLRSRLDAFSREIGLAAKRGRPKSDVNFWRACFYWYVRYGGLGASTFTHAEAIEILANDSENCDESVVAKAVRAHPETEALGKAMADAEASGNGLGK